MKHTLIVLMGVSAAGKTTLAKYIKDNHEDCVIISRDSIRFAMLQEGDDYFKYEKQVEKNYYEAISRATHINKYVIADATHITLKSRNRLFANIDIPSDTRIIGIYIETSLSTAIKQNNARTGRARVPEDVIKRMFKQKVSPRENEPFDEVIFISKDANLSIGKDGKFKDVLKSLREI